MNWFEKLVGFRETTPDEVRAQLIIEGEQLRSRVNGKVYQSGKLATPSLAKLRKRAADPATFSSQIKVSEVVGDIQHFHVLPENAGAMIQAASQFNLLEMVGPNVSPEDGIGRYEHDNTQGPACAIACGAGTIYRNYFVPVNDQIGQSTTQQIDCLDELGKALNNEQLALWEMKNGYALATEAGLQNITQQIIAKSPQEYDELKSKLRIGIQWDTEVTIDDQQQRLSQAYCSALPIAYSRLDVGLWETFARLILEATYEATFCAALINHEVTGNNRLYLTLVGGGAFGNKTAWITDALQQTIKRFSKTPLDVRIVSYGHSNPDIQSLLNK
jgi:hypothetical protein